MAKETIAELLVNLGLDSSDFDKSVTQINRTTTQMEKSFKSVKQALSQSEKGFDDYAKAIKSGENLISQYETKLKALSKSYEQGSLDLEKMTKRQKELPQLIQNAKSELDKLQKTLGENSEEYKKQEKVLNNLQSEYKNMDKSISNSVNSLRRIETEITNTENKLNVAQREVKEFNSELSKLGSDKNGLNSLSNKLDEISNKTNKLGKSIKSSGEKITNVGDKFAGASTAATGFVGASIAVGATFEKQMSAVQAISGATGKDLENLTETAKRLGAETKYSSAQVASGFEFMSLAGYSVEEMLGSIEPMLSLATAGNLELSRASDLTTDSMSALGKGVEDLGEYLDQVAKTSTKTNTSVGDLMEAFIETGGMAKTLGIDTAELSSALGVLANAGYKGSQAGNALSTILTRLAKPPAEAEKALKKLGVRVFDDKGKFLGLENILGKLNKAFSKLSEEEQAYYAKSIGGQNFLSQFIELVGQADGNMQDLTSTIRDSSGALETMSDTMGDNFLGKADATKSAIEGALNKAFESMQPILEDLLDLISDVANWFSSLDEDTLKLVTSTILLTAGMYPLLKGFGGLIIAGGNAVTLLGALSKNSENALGGFKLLKSGGISPLASLLGNPYLLIPALVGLIATIGENESALLKMQEKWGSFGIVFSGLCEYISGLWDATVGHIILLMNLAMDSLAAIIDGPGGQTVKDAWKKYNANVQLLNNEALSKLSLSTTQGLSNLRNITDGELNNIVGVFQTLTSEIPNIVDGNYQSAAEKLANRLSGMTSEQISALTALDDNTRSLFAMIRDDMSIDEIIPVLINNFELMRDAGKLNGEDLEKSISKSMKMVESQMKNKSESGAKSFSANMNSAKESVDKSISEMNKTTQAGMSSMSSSFIDESGKIPKDIEKNLNKSKETLTKTMNEMKAGASTEFDSMRDNIRKAMISISNITTNQSANAKNNAINNFNQMANSINRTMSNLRSNVSNQWNSIRNSLSRGIQGNITVRRQNLTRSLIDGSYAVSEIANESVSPLKDSSVSFTGDMFNSPSKQRTNNGSNEIVSIISELVKQISIMNQRDQILNVDVKVGDQQLKEKFYQYTVDKFTRQGKSKLVSRGIW